MATIEWQPPPSPSHKPSRSGEIQHSTHLHLKGSDGGGKRSAQCSLISRTQTTFNYAMKFSNLIP